MSYRSELEAALARVRVPENQLHEARARIAELERQQDRAGHDGVDLDKEASLFNLHDRLVAALRDSRLDDADLVLDEMSGFDAEDYAR